jgi:hypothetical protein
MSNVNGGTITVRVQGQDVGLSDLLARINAQMATSGGNARNYAQQMAQISPIMRQTDNELGRYAQSLAAVAKAQGDTAGSQRILAQGLQGITPATTAANSVMLQLQNSLNAQDAAAKKAQFSFGGLAQGLTTLVSGYLVATRVISTFGEAIGQGNELEKTLTTFRVLSGSQEQYAKNMDLARQQQSQFGGSLNDVVEGMSSFANLSARTGIEINKLTNVARALATVDPAQGFKGAGIALKEFFSGEITSLARRFEIPREALNGVEKIADVGARFEALTAVLNTYGISQELVTAQANTTAVTYDKLAGSVADATAAIGGLLAKALLPVAKQIGDVAQEAAVGLNALTTRADQLQGFTGKIFDSTAKGGVDAFNASIRETNAAIDGNDPVMGMLIGHLQELTPAQYAYVAALQQTTGSSAEALATYEATAPQLERIAEAIQFSGLAATEGQAAQDAFGIALAQTAAMSAEAAGFAEGLAIAVANGLPVEEAYIALQQFKANAIAVATAAQAEANAVTEAGLVATDNFTQGLNNEALAKTTAQIAGDALKITQEQLYAAALAAAQGMGATAGAAAALAQQFGFTTQEAYGLITALQQLEVAKAKQTLGLGTAPTNGRGDNILATPAQLLQQAKDLELKTELKKVQDANALAAANNAGKLEIQRQNLARLTAGTVEYEKQLGVVQAAERAVLAEQERAAKKGKGGAAAPKLTPNEKIENKLLDQQQKENDKYLDAEQKHWDKVAAIYEKFNEEQQKQFSKNEVSKRRSKADFYGNLQDTAEGVDTSQFAAQYEAAFAEAQAIAQTGKAKLANEFLELRQNQIEEMKALAEEAAAIKADEAEGKISEEEAEAQLAYLEARKKLIEDAQREEQQQLLAQGDANINALNEQLSAEEKAYQDNVDKIALSAERKADAVITNAARTKIAISEENKVLAENEERYRRIAAMNGGVVPKAQAATATTALPAGETQDKAVDVTATSPIPVTTADALIVRQAELFIVHDADVMASIGDMAARIEGKLNEVVTAVNSAKESISGAVKGVESAVGRIKINVPSVVGA